MARRHRRRGARKNPSTTTWVVGAAVAAAAAGAWWWWSGQQGLVIDVPGAGAPDVNGYAPTPAPVPASSDLPTATYPVATEAGVWAGRAGGAAPVDTSSGPMSRPTATLSTADQKRAKTLIAQYTAAVARGDTKAAATYFAQLKLLGVTPSPAAASAPVGMTPQRRG